MSPFLAWGDFHAHSRFARSTIPEEKWGTTRSLVTYKLISFATHPNLRRHQPMLRFLETIKRKCLLKQPNLVTSYNGAYLFSVICMPMMINYLHILGFHYIGRTSHTDQPSAHIAGKLQN